MSTAFGFQQLRKGMKARVHSVAESTAHSFRLLEMGLTPGTEFVVTKVAPLGDPVEIRLRGHQLCLRRSESDGLRIEPVE